MEKKKTNTVVINFIFILSIIIVVVTFSLSNYIKFDKAEKLLNQLDEEVVSTEELSTETFGENLAEIGLDIGNVGLGVLNFILVWIPLFHIGFLFTFTLIAFLIFRPTHQRTTAYRVLMTFSYLNIVVIIVVMIAFILIYPSLMKKIKMGIFTAQCLAVLIWNCYTTYSKRLYDDYCKKTKETYDKDNLIPVMRASICTGEKVVGFKNIHNGKFEEVMLIKNDDDIKKFTKKYKISLEDIKKEW